MNNDTITAFATYLWEDEKAQATIEKYVREAKRFLAFMESANLPGSDDSAAISKATVLSYKESLLACGYSANGINAMLAGLRAFLCFLGRSDIRVKNLRIQRKTYIPEERILRRSDYRRLLQEARYEGDEAMVLIMESLAATGIRISELQYFTKEAVTKGEVTIRLKGKERTILLPQKLRRALLRFAERRGIVSGTLFLNGKGAPLHRSSIWAKMKRLAKRAGVALSKVFPHNLRKLFARVFYQEERDIAKLADLLGHSSVDTTKIYLRESQIAHRRSLEGLGLML